MLKFDNNENSVRMFFEIPVTKSTGISLNNEKELIHDQDKRILSAFAVRLLGSLERRMAACESKLMNHLGNALTNGKVIYWMKKDQTYDHFVIASYEAMAKAAEHIKCEKWSDIMYNELILDQIIKALLNDTEHDHSDSNGYTYAQLITLLMAMYNNIIRDRTLGKGGL